MRPLTPEEFARARTELRLAQLKVPLVTAAAGVFSYLVSAAPPTHLDLGLLVLLGLALVIAGLFIESLTYLRAIKHDLTKGLVQTTAGPITYVRRGKNTYIEIAGKIFKLHYGIVRQLKEGEDISIHELPRSRFIVRIERGGQELRVPFFIFFGALALTVVAISSGNAEASELGRVPIEYRAPTLLVEARVNGSKPLWFAFDTGTSTCLIDVAVAQRLGIKPEPRPGRAGPGFARARSLAVGRAEARDLELVLRDLSPLSERLGVEVSGILGIAWMEQFVFEIDYRARRLTFWPRTVELTPRADQLPVPLEVRSPPGFTGATLFVPMTLEGEHQCPAEIDTGADSGVLGRAMAERLGVALKPIASAEEGGLPRHTVGRVELGGRTFAAVPFVVDPRRAAANPYGQCVVGNELLKAFVVTIDIPRRRAFFQSLP